MERNANYTLVGFLSLLLLVGMIAFIVWLGRFQFNKEHDTYDIVFVGSVSGLSVGGEVLFNGIKVGEVTRLSLDASDPNKVIARTLLGSNVPVRTDSFATLEPMGITGVNVVQLTAGTPTNPLLKNVTPVGKIPVIRTQTSALADLLKGGGTVLARAVEALDKVSAVLSKENVSNFSGILADLNVVSASAKDNKQLFQNADTAIASLNQAAKDISGLSNSAKNLVDNQGTSTLNNFSQAADELKSTATDIRTTVNSLKGPANDFANNTLPQVQSTISSLQGAADSLDRLANEIESDPRSLITKEPAKEIKVAP